MHPRVRAVLLAGAALVALVPSSGAAALAAHGVPAMPHTAGDQGLTWSVVPSPSRGDSVLNGVSCPSASSCIAVGSKGTSGGKTLAETWNGTAWSVVPSPNRHGGTLSGVSCVSASACTAVGWSGTSEASLRTLVETWNGSTWSIVPSPSPHKSQGGDILFGVSCVTAAFCAAVGSYGQASATEPVTEIWNGQTWSAVPNPNKTLDDGTLESVSCVSATACTAVGEEYQETVVESWNGAKWSLVHSPDRTSDPNFSSVSCTSATACTAVGTYVDDSLPDSANQTLVESNDGGTWSVVPSANAGGDSADDSLAGVSCASPSACIAVGNYGMGGLTSGAALIEAWNGTEWSLVPAPAQRGFGTLLYGVSCPSATTCMATGVRYGSSSRDSGRTLTELGTSSS